MKNILTIILILTTSSLFAQPELMSYQAIVRDADGQLVADKVINISIKIRQSSVSGTLVYHENHSQKTNSNGLISLQIGNGDAVIGQFKNIKWADDDFYVETATDPAGGTNLSVIGTSQLLSVPYALHAKSAGMKGVNIGDMRYWNGDQWINLPAGTNGQYLQMQSDGKPAWTGITTPGDPILGTVLYSNIGLSSVTLESEVFGDGGNTVTSRGFVLDTLPNPDVTDINVSAGSDVGKFNATINTLKTGKTYYVRSFATNSMGVTYGKEVSFATKVPKVGDTGPAGGIIFYVDGKGGGMECAPEGHDFLLRWSVKNYDGTNTYATDSSIYSGQLNTMKIINAIGKNGQAAYACDTFSLNGYTDWYLPSLGQLRLMNWRLDNKGLAKLKKDKSYWSSTQISIAPLWSAHILSFLSDKASTYLSFNSYNVRPVRSF